MFLTAKKDLWRLQRKYVAKFWQCHLFLWSRSWGFEQKLGKSDRPKFSWLEINKTFIKRSKILTREVKLSSAINSQYTFRFLLLAKGFLWLKKKTLITFNKKYKRLGKKNNARNVRNSSYRLLQTVNFKNAFRKAKNGKLLCAANKRFWTSADSTFDFFFSVPVFLYTGAKSNCLLIATFYQTITFF